MHAIKRPDFLCLIDKLLALAPGTVKGPETLANFEAWDSLAAMGFVALLDDKLGITLPSGRLEHCATVADLVAVAGSQVQS
jgi:acyl carrier protein